MEQKFREDVAATQAERARVRRLVADGCWKQVEGDTARFRRFAARRMRTRAARGGAEAVQGDSLDYQPASFLSEGATVRRAVAYVEASFGTRSTVGSGFMISPRLFITNQHVIPDAQAALGAAITFDRELDEQGRPRPVTSFVLDPGTFALFSDEDVLDYAVIAVGARQSGAGELADFGWCPLSNAPDKHVLGMSTNIIQHPNGQRKLISVRRNLLVARSARTLLYETDTDVGSSGSPVFNDDWDVVALHHYGEPFLETADDAGQPIPRTVNEGIRISALVDDLTARQADVPPAAGALLAQALALGRSAATASAGPRLGPPRQPGPEALRSTTTDEGALAMTTTAPKAGALAEFVIPLRVTLTIDGMAAAATALAPAAPAAAAAPALQRLTRLAEAIRVDADYSNRDGYDAAFIPGVNLPLPGMSASLAREVAPLRATEPDAAAGELKYQHFSVKLNRSRRLAIFTATNIDGPAYLEVDRDTGEVRAPEGETWFRDPRVSESFTLNQDFYSAWSTFFDRGHLTRRVDPTWGTPEQASRANADTYHFANGSPQHFRFNQSTKFWQGVERYVLETGVLAQDSKRRLCVFQGPIFDDRIDRMADEVQIPSSFFKVVVWRGADKLKAVGLVVDQGPLLDEARVNLGPPRAPSFVDVKQWRVPIASIEKKTGLDFGAAVRAADTIRRADQPGVGEEAMHGLLITRLSDITL